MKHVDVSYVGVRVKEIRTYKYIRLVFTRAQIFT